MKQAITLEVLEILDAIDRRGSFAKAAEELNKVTSAVSYSVQKLEEQLDLVVFQRQGRRSVLTPAGQLLLNEGRKILSDTHRLQSAVKEIATGWEPTIRIAIEATHSHSHFFKVLAQFIETHPDIEVDVCESVLNGGWEALEQDRVELVVGAPGPVPLQKGYRAVALGKNDLVLVIASSHQHAALANDVTALTDVLPTIRRVITHDTSRTDITRSEGLSRDGRKFYVQTMEQKVAAILSGLGVGHVPRHRVQHFLDEGKLTELSLKRTSQHENFLVWKISNKGKGLKVLTEMLVGK